MARISNKDRVLNLVDGLSTTALGTVATLLESIINLQSSEDLSDLETATVSASRRKNDKSEKSGKTASKKKVGRPRKTDEDEDEKPARRKRRAAKAEEPEDDEIEPFDGTPTVEDCFDFLDDFEGEPVEGGVRELSARVKELGGDPKEISDADKRADRAADFGMFIAACDALAEKLALHDDDDIEELAEELDVEPSKRKKTTIKSIIVALNSMEDDDNGGDEEDDNGNDDEDEDDEDEKPAKRRGRKSKNEDDDLDGIEDIDD